MKAKKRNKSRKENQEKKNPGTKSILGFYIIRGSELSRVLGNLCFKGSQLFQKKIASVDEGGHFLGGQRTVAHQCQIIQLMAQKAASSFFSSLPAMESSAFTSLLFLFSTRVSSGFILANIALNSSLLA